MTQEVQPGRVIDHTPTSALANGAAVAIGALLGVALAAIAANEAGSVQIEGVFTLPKLATGAIAQGAAVNWNGTAITTGAVTGGGTITGCGVCVVAAADGATTIQVKLSPTGGTAG